MIGSLVQTFRFVRALYTLVPSPATAHNTDDGRPQITLYKSPCHYILPTEMFPDPCGKGLVIGCAVPPAFKTMMQSSAIKTSAKPYQASESDESKAKLCRQHGYGECCINGSDKYKHISRQFLLSTRKGSSQPQEQIEPDRPQTMRSSNGRYRCN